MRFPTAVMLIFQSSSPGTLQLPLMTFGLVLPLSLLGMFILRKSIKSHAALLLFFAAHCIALLMFFVNARYRLIVVPVLLIYAGAAVAWLIEKSARGTMCALLARVQLWSWFSVSSPGRTALQSACKLYEPRKRL